MFRHTQQIKSFGLFALKRVWRSPGLERPSAKNFTAAFLYAVRYFRNLFLAFDRTWRGNNGKVSFAN